MKNTLTGVLLQFWLRWWCNDVKIHRNAAATPDEMTFGRYYESRVNTPALLVHSLT